MQFRNPEYNEHGTIDCEINHPDYGWIPHTIPADENPQLQAAAIEAGPAPYTPPPAPDPAIALAEWRNNAVASKVQIRFALLQMGLLATVQSMADADPYASIAWEYADAIRRASPFIDGLKGEAFTDAQIDDMFRFAMGVQL
jgi:hypothetical protein